LLQVLPYLEAVFVKNKSSFGAVLLDCFNYFLIYGKNELTQRPDLLGMFFRMAETAMFTSEGREIVNNSEGALLIQVMLQIFQGSTALNDHLENSLNRVTERLKNGGTPITNKILKKHLLGVFVASLYYNAGATLTYLKNNGIMKDVLIEIFKLKVDFRESYEQKSFVLGLTAILRDISPQSMVPDEIKHPHALGKIIQEVMEMLMLMKKREEKQLKN